MTLGSFGMTGAPVLVADLTGSVRHQRMIVWLTHLYGRSHVIIPIAPLGHPVSEPWPRRHRLHLPEQLRPRMADRARLAEVDAIARTVDRPELQLLRDALSAELQTYMQLRDAVEYALVEGAGFVHVLTLTQSMAEALRIDFAHQPVVQISPLSRLPRPRHRRPTAPVSVSQAPPARFAEPGGVLCVSESLPMELMFDAIDVALHDRSCGPVVRVHFGSAVEAPERRQTPTRYIREIRPDRWDAPPQAIADESPGRVAASSGLAMIAAHWERAALRGGAASAAQRQLQLADAYLRAMQPDVVVVGNDRHWIGAAFVQAARAAGVPSICVQDGVAAHSPLWHWFNADVLLANGDFLGDFVNVDQGQRVRVTGQPRYDALKPASNAESLRCALGLAEDSVAALFAAQVGQHPQFIRSVLEQMHRSGVGVLFRTHPSAQEEGLAVFAACAKLGPQKLVNDVPVDLALRAADVLVTEHSTVAIEALLAGRAVITADFTGLGPLVPYAALGLSEHASSAAELVEILRRHRAAGRPRPPRAGYEVGLESLIGPRDGGAAARVAAEIVCAAARRVT